MTGSTAPGWCSPCTPRRPWPKDDFPTARVYGDTDQPELRLLTCGGPFDPQTKHYLDNVVVYAKQVAE